MLFTAIEIQSSLRGCMIEHRVVRELHDRVQSSLRGCMIEYKVV